jgi:hypothetical protein
MSADSTTTNINNLLAGSGVRIQVLLKKFDLWSWTSSCLKQFSNLISITPKRFTKFHGNTNNRQIGRKYEFYEYEPVYRTNLNTAGEIQITIELQNLFTHPAKSYLYKLMNGLLKPTGAHSPTPTW